MQFLTLLRLSYEDEESFFGRLTKWTAARYSDLRTAPTLADTGNSNVTDTEDSNTETGLLTTSSLYEPGIFSGVANDILAIVGGTKEGDWKRLFDTLLVEDKTTTRKRRKTTNGSIDPRGYGVFCFDESQAEIAPSKGRTGVLDHSSRMKALEVRNVGACYRCQVQRKSVSL
jgi:hypothetical protein